MQLFFYTILVILKQIKILTNIKQIILLKNNQKTTLYELYGKSGF